MPTRYNQTKRKLTLMGMAWLFIMIFSATDINAQVHCKVFIYVQPDFCNTGNVILHSVPWNTLQPPITFLWSTGETTQDISVPANSGTYSVTVSDGAGCVVTESVDLNAFNLTYFIQQFNGCPYEPIYLAIEWNNLTQPGNYEYEWSNGDMTSVATVTMAGTYTVTITDPISGCSVVLSIDAVVNPEPTPTITGTPTLCSGNPGSLTVLGGPYTSIFWFPGGWDTETVTITEPDTYMVTVYNEFGCVGIATFEVISSGDLPVVVGPATLCSGQMANLTITNPGLFTSINWSDGSTMPSMEIFGPGQYSVTVTDMYGCDAVEYIDVLDTSFGITGTETPNTSCGSPNGMIDITVTPAGSYTYAWSNGASTEDINNLSPGTYNVTVTGSSGCTNTTSVTIGNSTSSYNITGITTDNTSCTTPNGSINLTVTPSGSYTFNWSNGSSTEDINNLTSGSYSVTVTDAASCSSVATFTIADNVITPILTTSTINANCGQANGSINLTVTPLGSYVFSWSNGAGSEDISNLSAGNYTVTVTSSNGCTATTSTTILNDNSSFNITGITTDNTSCLTPNGSINLTVTPSGSYTFNWSNGASTEDINNLTTGSYSVTVTDAASCSSVATFTIADNVISPILTTATINANCGQSNGSINLTVTPLGSYVFSWSNGAGSEDISNLSAGIYNVTVTSSSGCTATTSTTILNDNSSFNITGITTDNTSCLTPNGSINLTITPSGSYTFNWSNGASTEDINNLTSGSYSVTVTDATSCSSVATFTIADNVISPILTTAMINANCGQANGSINLTVTPLGSYVFTWSNGASSEDISNLSAGIYNVTVTGSNGCTATTSTTILNDNSSFNITGITTDNISCTTPNGSINLTITPSGSYTFSWSNGASTEDINILTSGLYIVTVTDAASCSSVAIFTIADNVISPILTTATINANCGQANGSINLTVTPIGSYVFSWSNGAGSEDISNLSAGNYTVTVTSSNGCTATTSTTILNDNSSFNITGTTTDNTSCTTPNGSINLTVTPSGSYTFSWSNGASTEDINILTSGLYIVTVTDAASCSSVATFTIADNVISPILTTATINANCGQANGSINLSVSPSGSYVFTWSNGASSEDISNLSAGIYNVTVTSSSGCTATTSSTILNDNSTFNITGITTDNTSCLTPNGSINLTITPSGSYTFNWSNASSTEDINNLTSGLYIVTVTDAASCSSVATFTIADNVITPILTTSTINANCGQANGSINLTVTPLGSYVFLWSNGASSEDISNLSAGNYTVTVTGSNGCTVTTSSTILNDNSSFNITGITTENTSCLTPNGSINLTITPSGSYTFIWSNAESTEDINNLMSGSYSITVTDAASCSSVATFTILENKSLPLIELLAHAPDCFGNAGWIEVLVPSSPNDLTYSMDRGLTFNALNQIDDLSSGDYEVMVKNGLGCITVQTIHIPEQQELTIQVIPEISLKIGVSQQIEVDIADLPIAQIDSIIWTPTNGLFFADTTISSLLHPTFLDAPDGLYTVTIYTHDGCSADAAVNVRNVRDLDIYAPNIIHSESSSVNNSFYLVSKPGSVKMINTLSIFDRWGNLVFLTKNIQPDDPTVGWTGTFRGQAVNPAVFVWVAEITFIDDSTLIKKGDVTVIR